MPTFQKRRRRHKVHALMGTVPRELFCSPDGHEKGGLVTSARGEIARGLYCDSLGLSRSRGFKTFVRLRIGLYHLNPRMIIETTLAADVGNTPVTVNGSRAKAPGHPATLLCRFAGVPSKGSKRDGGAI